MKRIIDYINIFFLILLIFIVIRFLEYSYIYFINDNKELSLDMLFGKSINFDSLFVINTSLVFLVPYLLISIWSEKISIILIRIISILLVFVHLILTSFFIISWNLLDATVFEFSVSEIWKIIMTEISYQNLMLIILLILFLTLTSYLVFKILPKIKYKKNTSIIVISIYTTVSIITLINHNHTSKSIRFFDNNYLYYLGNSKEVFFIKSLINSSHNDYDFVNIKSVAERFQKSNPKFKYCSKDFPFIHNEKYNNVLGDYFIKDTTIKPNIVLIISESLSSFFSGKNNLLGGSLTQFIDSLSQQSLYWENFLSNAERSYGVLPNILSSLPTGVGSRGFLNMDYEYSNFRKYPIHTGLIELLKNNGYYTSFFYGGWGYFDNEGYFLKEDGIDNFISEENFDKKRYHKPEGKNSWGYNDKDLFSQSFTIFDDKNIKQPFLNIYQTLSLHSPFNLCEDEYYDKEFIKKRLKELNIDSKNINKIPENILSSIFFVDDAMKYYFQRMQKRKEFENTIFIITGDHSLGLNVSNNVFETYRVPLIIYSKLLKKNESFKGVCSHIDILPSIIALLQDNYNLKFEKKKHWLGEGLDTSLFFNQERNFPLVINNDKNLPQYVYGNNVIIGDNVYCFDSLFNINKEIDTVKVNKVKQVFSDYKTLNNYVCIKNKIWNTKECTTKNEVHLADSTNNKNDSDK